MTSFVYVKIPAAALPEHELHAALEEALMAQGLGSLVGWGASVGGVGLRPAFHRIDIEVVDLPRALEVLKAALAAFGAPPRSELHFTREGEALQQELGPEGWSASRPTTAAHRGRR